MRQLLGFIFLLTGFSTRAQFTDSTTHYFRVGASGSLNRSNNTTAYLLNNDVRFSIHTKHTTVNTGANWLYGEQGGNLTNNDFSTAADFNLFRDSSNLYYWALANYTTSYSLKIRGQLQSGIGAAFNFFNTPTAWLNLSEGILYETNTLATSNPADDHYQTYRNSLRLSYKFIIHKLITTSGSNFLQQAFGDGNDYIIRTSNSLNVKLNSWISIGTTIMYNRYKRTGTDNLFFTYGLSAEKYF